MMSYIGLQLIASTAQLPMSFVVVSLNRGTAETQEPRRRLPVGLQSP